MPRHMFEIGNTLREARLRRGLDVNECELGTKIRAKYLRAMEEEHFDLLPSPAYVRGFLRTYAEYLGLDGQLVTDEYESRFGVRDHHDADPRRARAGARPGQGRRATPPRRGAGADRRRTETQLLWLAIGGVMTVALLVWMGVGNPSQETPPIAGTVPAPVAVPQPDDALATPEAPEALRITLTGVGGFGSYVEVRARNRDGRRLFAGTLGDGQRQVFTVPQALFVRTYNAEGLRVTVKGKTTQLTGGTGDFLIRRGGVTPLETASGN